MIPVLQLFAYGGKETGNAENLLRKSVFGPFFLYLQQNSTLIQKEVEQFMKREKINDNDEIPLKRNQENNDDYDERPIKRRTRTENAFVIRSTAAPLRLLRNLLVPKVSSNAENAKSHLSEQKLSTSLLLSRASFDTEKHDTEGGKSRRQN